MRYRCKAIVLSVMLLITSFCSLVGADEQAIERTLVQDNSSFALDLYQKLLSYEGNIFFSPFIISTAFAMTYAGARGETEMQMAKAMYFSFSHDKLHPAFSNLQDKLNKVQKKGRVQFHVANSLWPHNKYPFKDKLLSLLKENYKTDVTAVDYVRHAEKARKAINTWIEDKTRDKIKDLIPQGTLNQDTRLVLANAIYFKGNWKNQFGKKNTRNTLFSLSLDKMVKTPMMYQNRRCSHWADKDLQVLRMPYVDTDLSMLVLLPTKIDGLSQLEQRLTIENLKKWTAHLRYKTVDIVFPKFKLEYNFRLDRALQAIGMVDAFTDNANFSGMDGTDWLYISAILHKAFIDVNEEGTEAVATNAALKQASNNPTPLFLADHPFVFLIQENQTGSIQFIGRITDPTKTL